MTLKNTSPLFLIVPVLVLAGLPDLRTAFAADTASAASDGLLAYVEKASAPNRRSWIAGQLTAYRKFPRLDLTFRLMKAGRLGDARRELDRLLAVDPEDLGATSIYMIVLYEERNYEGSLRLSQDILKRYPAFAPALIYRGLAWQTLGKTENALNDFAVLADSHSLQKNDYVFSLDTLADLALSRQQYDQALKALEKLAVYKSDTRLYVREGMALDGLGRTDAAAGAFGRALVAASSPGERLTSLRFLGDLNLRQHDWVHASAWYRSALAIEPDNPDLLHAAARAAFQTANYTEATRLLQHLLAIHPNAEDRLYLGNVLVAANNPRAAEAEFRIVLTSTRDEKQLVPAYRSLIELASERNDIDEATRLARTLLKLSSAGTDHRTLLVLLEQRKDLPAMVEELQKYLAEPGETVDNRFEACMKLGNVYSLLRQDENAAAAFRDAVRLKQTTESLNALSQVLERLGRVEDAVSFRTDAAQLSSSPDLLMSLGLLREKAGQPEEAIAALDSAVKNGAAPELLFDIYVHEGYINFSRHRYAEARLAFDQALRLHSENAELNASMARVCIELRDYGSALPYLEKARATVDSSELLKLTAMARIQTGDLETGAAIYQKLLSQYPHPSRDAEETDMALGYLESSRGNFTQAARHLLKAFEDGWESHSDLLTEAAQNLAQARDWKTASETYIRYANLPNITEEARWKGWESTGYVCMSAGDYRTAADAFRRALESGDSNPDVRRGLAFSLYQLKEWRPSLDQFLVSLRTDRNVRALAGAARCYQQLNKPGLAIYYFKEALDAPDSRNTPDEHQAALKDLAYLQEGAGEYAFAAQTVQILLRPAEDFALRLRLARDLRLAGSLKAADQAMEVVKPGELSASTRVMWLDERAAILTASGDRENARRALIEANNIEPAAWRDYQLGLGELSNRNASGALSFFRAALEKEPDNILYVKALAYGSEASGDDAEAARMFKALVARDPQNVQWLKSLAYADMRLSRNMEAAEWFRKVIDTNKVTGSGYNSNSAPYTDLSQDDYAIRSEISRLTQTYQLTFYRGFTTNSYTGTGALDFLGGDPFPAPSGIEFAWQPPHIGLRNGRSFQVFARVLWNDPNNSLSFNSKLYQASAGIRYKPLARQNLWLSAENIFHPSEYSTGKWLLRTLYSWNPGFELKPGKARWAYTLAYSDTAFVPGKDPIFAQYGEGRRGLTFNLKNSLLLTPHLVADARWQSGSLVAGSYLEAGGGLSMRFLFRQNQYEAQRSSFEVVLQCKRGTFGAGGIGYTTCTSMGIVRF